MSERREQIYFGPPGRWQPGKRLLAAMDRGDTRDLFRCRRFETSNVRFVQSTRRNFLALLQMMSRMSSSGTPSKSRRMTWCEFGNVVSECG